MNLVELWLDRFGGAGSYEEVVERPMIAEGWWPTYSYSGDEQLPWAAIWRNTHHRNSRHIARGETRIDAGLRAALIASRT